MRAIYLTIFNLFFSLICFCQISQETLFFEDFKLKVYTYKLENDTINKVYFDESKPRVYKTISSNLGPFKKDVTFFRINDFLDSIYTNYTLSYTNLEQATLTPFNENLSLESKFAITTDCYWIGAINFYTNKIKVDSSDFLNYYELANAILKYYNISSSGYNERILSLLDKSIALNRNFERAYFLKSKICENNAIWLGLICSEPHNDVINIRQIDIAIKCLNQLLIINPEHQRALIYRKELIVNYY